jgi:hypothetical protein
MEQNEVNEPRANQAVIGHDASAITPSQENVAMPPPAGQSSCPTCTGGAASMPVSYVYALGRIEARFPRLSVEKEFVQVAGRSETAGKTGQQVFHTILSKRENRYLQRFALE